MLEKIALAGTIGAGVVVGLLWPTQSQVETAVGVDILVERNTDHHYYADAYVNGRPVHFMIDTGAGETALTEADAQQAGIPIDPGRYEVIGDGASGMIRGQYVQLKSIDVGGIKQENAKAVVVAGATVSLLGQPFLEQVDEITIRKGEMHLRRTRTLVT